MKMKTKVAVLGGAAAMACACRLLPPQGALTFNPDYVVFQPRIGILGDVIQVKSTGVIPVTITGVEIDVDDPGTGTTDIVKTVDSPKSCLHPVTSNASVAFRVLNPGQSCEVVLEVAKIDRAGKGELRLVDEDGRIYAMEVKVTQQ